MGSNSYAESKRRAWDRTRVTNMGKKNEQKGRSRVCRKCNDTGFVGEYDGAAGWTAAKFCTGCYAGVVRWRATIAILAQLDDGALPVPLQSDQSGQEEVSEPQGETCVLPLARRRSWLQVRPTRTVRLELCERL